MAAGFATATRGLLLFALAGGLAWLFAARAVQGLAVGMISGAAAAALVELDPAPQEDRAALFAALAQAGGSASGRFLAGMLAEWAPAPLVLPFAVFICLGVAATVAALAIPEPGRVVGGRLHVAGRACRADSRPVRPRERHRRRRLGGRGVLPLGSAVLRRGAAGHVEPGAARRGQRGHARDLVRGADHRPPRHRVRPHAGDGARAARRSACWRSCSPSRPTRCSSCWPRACCRHRPRHRVPRQPVATQRRRPARPRGAVNAAFYTLIYLGVATAIVSTGLLTLHFALSTAVTTFATVIATVALLTAAWHLKGSDPFKVRTLSWKGEIGDIALGGGDHGAGDAVPGVAGSEWPRRWLRGCLRGGHPGRRASPARAPASCGTASGPTSNESQA